MESKEGRRNRAIRFYSEKPIETQTKPGERSLCLSFWRNCTFHSRGGMCVCATIMKRETGVFDDATVSVTESDKEKSTVALKYLKIYVSCELFRSEEIRETQESYQSSSVAQHSQATIFA